MRYEENSNAKLEYAFTPYAFMDQKDERGLIVNLSSLKQIPSPAFR